MEAGTEPQAPGLRAARAPRPPQGDTAALPPRGRRLSNWLHGKGAETPVVLSADAQVTDEPPL